METEDPSLFNAWTANWHDLVEFEIVPVISSAEAAARAAGLSLARSNVQRTIVATGARRPS